MTRRTYKCKCGTIEFYQSITEAPLKKCDRCKEEFKQIYHVVPLVNLIGFTELSKRNAIQILEEGF